jgi:hypothetical protein
VYSVGELCYHNLKQQYYDSNIKLDRITGYCYVYWERISTSAEYNSRFANNPLSSLSSGVPNKKHKTRGGDECPRWLKHILGSLCVFILQTTFETLGTAAVKEVRLEQLVTGEVQKTKK